MFNKICMGIICFCISYYVLLCPIYFIYKNNVDKQEEKQYNKDS